MKLTILQNKLWQDCHELDGIPEHFKITISRLEMAGELSTLRKCVGTGHKRYPRWKSI